MTYFTSVMFMSCSQAVYQNGPLLPPMPMIYQSNECSCWHTGQTCDCMKRDLVDLSIWPFLEPPSPPPPLSSFLFSLLEGEKPFECRLCGQRSRDYSAMIKHLRTHSGAAPYQCTLCLEFCNSLVAMQRHIKSHPVQDFPPNWTINSTYLYTSHIWASPRTALSTQSSHSRWFVPLACYHWVTKEKHLFFPKSKLQMVFDKQLACGVTFIHERHKLGLYVAV